MEGPRRLLLGFSFLLILLGGPALAVEEPAFHTVLQDGPFEIRDYPPLVVAEVTVRGGQTQAASKGFRLLAAYIFGANRRRQALRMTAPVVQADAGQKIAMTAPVSQTHTVAGWVVRFTMPSSFSLETLPIPDDPRVHLRAAPAARLAVIRFSGVAWPKDVATKTAALEGWMGRRNLHAAGEPALAQYDPPWTVWFLRRNEVMIPIAR